MNRNLMALGVLIFATSFGCQLEKFVPEQVAGGVSRLGVRNAAVLVSIASSDEDCGFQSPSVLSNPTIEGEIGESGSITYRVEGCQLKFDTKTVVSESCTGTTIGAEGRAIINATQTIVGTLTGNPENPILPADADAVTMKIEAQYDNFHITLSDKVTSLKQVSGLMSYTAYPHLAVSKSLGICSVVTPNLTLEEIVMQDAKVIVDTGESVFPVDVPSSRYDAQLADYKSRDNSFSGEITVWDTTVPLPEPDGDIVLDPDHDRAEFWASAECTDDLQLPVSYECGSLLPVQAQGVSALTISSFGNLVSLADQNCFANVPALVTGELGREGGEARWIVNQPCEIEFTNPTPISTNCRDVTTSIRGKVRITGQKILRGVSTGDPLEPIAPTSRTPALIELEIEVVDALTITDDVAENSLTIQSGTLSGAIRPQTAIDLENNVCSFVTPIAAFENVSLQNALVTLNAAGNIFDLNVENALLQAQNGNDGNRENYLAGSITIEDEEIGIPVAGGDPVLDPNYTPERFFESFMCAEGIELTEKSEDCSESFYRHLGVNAGRLVAQTVGTVTGLVNGDGDCGFDGIWEKIQPDTVVGEVGEQGYMTWGIQDCALGAPALSVYSQNCTGGTTFVNGIATIDATRKVSGERERAFLVFPSIKPNFREAVEITLDTVILDEFVTYSIAGDATEPAGKMTVHQGTLTGTVVPILGERQDEEGTFDVATPLARLYGIGLNGANVTVESAGKTFKLTLDDVLIDAENGIYQGRGNQISGSMNINGIAITFGQEILDPGYSQGSFDQSYICTEDLRGLVPPQ